MDANVIKLDKIVNVIPKDDEEIPEPHILVNHEGENKKFCPHDHINIYQYHRKIFCKDCGAALDPFDFLVRVGNNEDSQFSNRIWLKYQIRSLEEDKERLFKDIVNLKNAKRNITK